VSIAVDTIMLSVIMMSVVALIVVAPLDVKMRRMLVSNERVVPGPILSS
jgi:hypothetical protein